MARRRGLSNRVRFLVLQRDGFRCRYCGATALDDRLEVDHVEAVVRGGSDHASNLVTACRRCNSGKSALEVRGVPPATDELREAFREGVLLGQGQIRVQLVSRN